MTKQKITRWIIEHGVALLEFYGLQEWNVRYTFGYDENAFCNGEFNFKTQASVARLPEYKRATVFINNNWIRDEEELYEVISHELLHIVCSSYILVYRALWHALPGGKARKILEHVWNQADEEAVLDLKRMSNGHMKWKNKGRITRLTPKKTNARQ